MIKEIIGKAQEGIDLWKGCLKTTRGAIHPEKSFVYVSTKTEIG